MVSPLCGRTDWLFDESRKLFDEHHDRLQQYGIINRWDLQPKDMDKYLAGELVEPVKPIVWYVDPAIPEKWRKYVKLGIADWNIAFEAIGFKNAIVVKDYPWMIRILTRMIFIIIVIVL